MSDNEWKITGPDGKEYEMIPSNEIVKMYCTLAAEQNCTILAVRPKRKQTGWICRACDRSGGYGCVILKYPYRPDSCPMVEHPSHWQPFYGKVIE